MHRDVWYIDIIHKVAHKLEVGFRDDINKLTYDLAETRKERDDYRKRLHNMVIANERFLEEIDRWRKAYWEKGGDAL